MKSPRIAALRADLSPGSVDAFWNEITATGTPLVEPWSEDCELVTFLWRGEAKSTRAWWGVDVELTRLPGTDLWYGSELLPAHTRTIYTFVHDGVERLPLSDDGEGTEHIDTANPSVFRFRADPLDPDDHDVWVSLLTLPGAPDEPWTAPRPEVVPGTITPATPFDSAAIGRSLPVSVYLPAGVPVADLPVMVVFDGYLAVEIMRNADVLDNLIAAGRIAPVAAIFVHYFERTRDQDLSPLPPTETFVVDELLPWAAATHGIGRPGADFVCGVSRGGLVATYLGLRRPDVFAGVISQSGSFWWPEPDIGEPGWLIREAAEVPVSDVRFYLDVGLLETYPGPGGAPNQVSVNRALTEVLRRRGFSLTYAEFAGGHDYLNWRRTFADAMMAVNPS